MRITTAVIAVAASIFMIGCSSGSTELLELGLQQRAEKYAGATSDENWSEVYQFLTVDFRENSSETNYIESIKPLWDGLKSFFGVDENQYLEVSVTKISVDGTTGVVETEIHFEGEALGGTPAGQPWVFKDNKWSPVIPDEEMREYFAACS